MKFHIEVTDTFGGEANYSWVNNYVIEVPETATDKLISQRAKKVAGWTGIRCDTEYLGEEIRLIPRNLCQIMFITPLCEAYT